MRISDAEWLVMRVVWQLGSVGAGDVIVRTLPGTGWSHRTVRTLLTRLVEKGVLTVGKDGSRNIYTPSVEQADCVREESQTFLAKVFDGDAGQMLVHFVENEEITPQQLEQLRAVLNAKQSENPGHGGAL